MRCCRIHLCSGEFAIIHVCSGEFAEYTCCQVMLPNARVFTCAYQIHELSVDVAERARSAKAGHEQHVHTPTTTTLTQFEMDATNGVLL